jgi:hypothetical protein
MFSKENESGVTAGILIWMSAAIMLVVMLPVLAAVLSATPAVSGPLNATQIAVNNMVASSYGLIIVVLIILAAVIILGVIAYLNTGQAQ